MEFSVDFLDRVCLGDCLDLMRQIPDNTIDLVACDLPYGVTQHKKDIALDLDILWKEYYRIAKINAAFVLTAQFPFTADLFNSNRKHFKYDMVWNKVIAGGFLNANRMPMRVHENILVFYRKQPTYNPQFTDSDKPLHAMGKSYLQRETIHQNYGHYERAEDTRKGTTKRHPTSIVTFAKPHSSQMTHRTQKSLELFKWIIATFSNSGDIVLDNCCGSGTTAVAAKSLGRHFVAMDSDNECVTMSESRVAELGESSV